ncbi:pyrroloquinoline quinone biosynthesis protein PqqB [Chryseobacterium sp. T16E-39]|uniref:MBL fold metallo-hydrolase n=1 Tax=Chryseobacterium sp. T16E-39 TaxID=2015076 RepID=UPI000B5B4122|nr:MBL fold metallo-hydrolase [Chryseobacterium sp. T16E-39]ASK32747.1 pyrroloquinoline quinone biosynthesis protein PqqB [Chryseobacterium sp. T16E-39]
MKNLIICASLLFTISCTGRKTPALTKDKTGIQLIVLGNVQDAGSPQLGCNKDCCKELWKKPDLTRKIISIGVMDYGNKKNYLFDASPDITSQLQLLQQENKTSKIVDGIFITHAHIGHYTGLMYLGKEALSAQNIPVYSMPKLKQFLNNNGPWSQLVTQHNIAIKDMENEQPVILNPKLKITPIQVPHRDEFSETVGFLIEGPKKKALFIPDIDKWGKWKYNIVDYVKKVDYAFIDATFYNAAELDNRDIATIPHPLVEESMELFKNLNSEYRKRVYFIHFNHTNKLLNPNSSETKTVITNGYHIARMGDIVDL